QLQTGRGQGLLLQTDTSCRSGPCPQLQRPRKKAVAAYAAPTKATPPCRSGVSRDAWHLQQHARKKLAAEAAPTSPTPACRSGVSRDASFPLKNRSRTGSAPTRDQSLL